MRLPTFSFLRSCRFKQFYDRVPARLQSSNVVQAGLEEDNIKGDANLVDMSEWPESEQPELRAAVQRDMSVLADFVTQDEESALLAELDPVLKKMRYEYDHWDNAIEGFRETERSEWQPHNSAVLRRVLSLAFTAGAGVGEPLPRWHVLDLAPAGHIKPHVDAVRFCGPLIAGLCLGSAAVMRLEHSELKHLAMNTLLPQRGLYIMRGVARYSFTHAVLGGELSRWRGERLVKRRRVAVICRSRPPPPPPPPSPLTYPPRIRPPPDIRSVSDYRVPPHKLTRWQH